MSSIRLFEESRDTDVASPSGLCLGVQAEWPDALPRPVVVPAAQAAPTRRGTRILRGQSRQRALVLRTQRMPIVARSAFMPSNVSAQPPAHPISGSPVGCSVMLGGRVRRCSFAQQTDEMATPKMRATGITSRDLGHPARSSRSCTPHRYPRRTTSSCPLRQRPAPGATVASGSFRDAGLAG